MSENVKQSLSNDTLKCLMRKVAEFRDKQAFMTLFDHYVPLVRAYSLKREPGASLLADELAQEVLIRVWEKAHTYNPSLSNLNTWVFTLARNCRIDHLRRNGRFLTEIDPVEIFNQIEDEGPGPFQVAQLQRYEVMLHESMRHLPKEQEQVLNKVYMEGKSHQQVSNELKLPLGTVKSRVRLALKKLTAMVKEDGRER